MNRRKAIQQVSLLMGGAVSSATMIAVMSGCKNEGKSISGVDFSLSTGQQSLLAEIAEMIIPPTDTPGAGDAGVAPFIELMLKDCYTSAQQKHFLSGLSQLNDEAQKLGDSFDLLTDDQKSVILSTMETLAREEREAEQKSREVDAETDLEKRDTKEPVVPFFHLMKELTLFGYFTSEIGIKQALAYDPIPQQYLGCIDLEPGQKAWGL